MMNIFFHINLQGLFFFSLFYIKMCRFIENQDLLRRVVGDHGDRKIKSHWPNVVEFPKGGPGNQRDPGAGSGLAWPTSDGKRSNVSSYLKLFIDFTIFREYFRVFQSNLKRFENKNEVAWDRLRMDRLGTWP